VGEWRSASPQSTTPAGVTRVGLRQSLSIAGSSIAAAVGGTLGDLPGACKPGTRGSGGSVEAFDGHSEQYRPLGSYLVLTGAFNGIVAAGLVAASRAGRPPERIRLGDVALGAVATYKLSRLVAKDRVTSGLRAPFTRFQEDSGHGEVEEAARGTGLRRAIGELLVCPNCLAQWVSAGFTAGFISAPRATRAVAAMFAVYAGADVLQIAHGEATSKLS
jgi:hypothetical protein